MRPLLAIAVLLATAGQTPAQEAPAPWEPELYDPAAVAGSPADLTLPMPCGGAMAFQRVTVPVEPGNPIADRRFRIGQPQAETGYSDYLQTAYLRGAFPGDSPGDTAYYIARYEMTEGQYRALTGDCTAPARRDRIAKGNLSWFDAVTLSRSYTEWLLTEARDSLPAAAEGLAFLRLPTEAEWEYAARGGAAVDPAIFPSRHFFGDGNMLDFAKLNAPGSARGKLLPVGLTQPNPLGLYDIYGNAEELMLEPFRLNAIGRRHGQVGGLVTRGGSVLSTPEQVYSAQRTEYPLFRGSDGSALASDTFGLRLVLSRHVTASDAALRTIRNSWIATAEESEGAADTPLGTLAALIDEETDPRRQSSLSELQLEFRRAQEEASAAFGEAAKSTLLNGAVLVGAMADGETEIARRRASVYQTVDQIRLCSDEAQCATLRDLAGRLTGELDSLRRLQRTYLVSLRSALETLSNGLEPEIVMSARELLRGELTASEQTAILANLSRFEALLGAYTTRPDMTGDDLRALVLAR